MVKKFLFCLGCLCLWTADAAPGTPGTPAESLNAAGVVALARARAPEVRIANTRVLDARARLAGAGVLSLNNPVIEGVANTDRRFERRTQLELSVPIELGFRRSRRVGVARAELKREAHLATDAGRRAVGSALAAYYRVLHAEQGRFLARERQELANDLLRTVTEKVRAGDAPRIDLLVAETESSRAASETWSQEHEVARSRMELAVALGVPSGAGLLVAGDLSDRSIVDGALADTSLAERPDLLAAATEVEAAASAAALARTALLPDLSLRWNYGHEGGEGIEQRGVALSVPLFDRGQGERGQARARHARAAAELGIQEAFVSAEQEGARAGYAASRSALDQFEASGLPRTLEIARMAEESYRSGKLNLSGVLVIRREALDTRREYLDRLLEAALSAVEVAVATGALR